MKGQLGRWERRIRILRDLVVAIGVPALAGLFWTLHTAQVNALEQQIAYLRETQYPRAAEVLEAQRKLCEEERRLSVGLAADVLKLASELAILSRPFGTEKETEEILGKDGDFGSYMEWAGPEIRERTNRLVRLLGEPN
jgi:hypothetical protein